MDFFVRRDTEDREDDGWNNWDTWIGIREWDMRIRYRFCDLSWRYRTRFWFGFECVVVGIRNFGVMEAREKRLIGRGSMNVGGRIKRKGVYLKEKKSNTGLVRYDAVRKVGEGR